jgi:hypothetical protein
MRLRRTAATFVAGVLILAGALGGSAVSAEAPAPLGYTCQFPAGPQPVGVRISVAVPERATVGKPIQPDAVAVNLVLPPKVLDAASVSGTVSLTVAVTQNGNSVDAGWSGLALPSTPVPADGELAVAATGAVASVTVAEPGLVTLVAGDLSLELVPDPATDPASWTVSCTLDPGQDMTLARVEVPEAGQPASTAPPSSAPGSPAAGSGITVDPAPRSAPDPGGIAPPMPPECGQITPIPTQEQQTNCAFAPGFSNVRKLKASILVKAPLVNVALGPGRAVQPPPGSPPGTPVTVIQDNLAEIAVPAGKFPPLEGTFLAFEFLPVTATLELTQIGQITIHGESQGSGAPCRPGQFPGGTPRCTQYFIRTTAQLAARIQDAKVNGVPLAVGPNCRTERPLDVVVEGGTPEFVNVRFGGPLSGFVEIPPFSGCGVTDDLDPLLTGMVSGPGNFIKVIQGALCNPRPGVPQSVCPPREPENPPPSNPEK